VRTFLRQTLRLLVLAGLALGLWRVLESRRSGALAGEPSFPDLRAIPTPPAPVRAGVDPVDGACPDGYPVKGKRSSGIYHVPGGLSYARTVPDRCYATPADAAADGLRKALR
jgi:hypothetical protein